MLSTARISTRLAVSLFPMSVNSSQSHCSTTDSLREDLSCMDSIRLNGLLFHGYHGVLPEVSVTPCRNDTETVLPLVP